MPLEQALYRREPVLEEFPVAMALHRDEADKNSDVSGDDDGDEEEARKRGVLEAQLSLPEVVNVNVTHAMVSALRKKALALSEVGGHPGSMFVFGFCFVFSSQVVRICRPCPACVCL